MCVRTQNKCDICTSDIIEGKCSCGSWFEPQEATKEMKIFSEGLETFHDMRQFIISGDSPHLGVAFVYFRGDYKDCEQVKHYIKKLKGRPAYEEQS